MLDASYLLYLLLCGLVVVVSVGRWTCDSPASRFQVTTLGGDAENARPENDGQRKLWVWKMQE